MTHWTEDYENSELIRSAVDRLTAEFAGTLSPQTVDIYVRESFEKLANSKVQSFIPLFTTRFARDRLTALGQVQGSVPKDVPEVLFICVQNAGRSQMAAALLHRAARGRVHVRSAGSRPADEIDANVSEALNEMGLDVSREFPKPLTDEVVRAADVVITMGCGDACPVYPGKRYLDWEVPDPAGRSLAEVRTIRDDIDRRVGVLLEELLVGAS